MRTRIGIAAVAIVVLALVPVLAVSGAVGADPPPSEVWVDDDACPGPGSGTPADPYCKIQDGIDAVASPGVVHVAEGTYSENITLKDGVQVLGAGADVATIDGSTARGGLPAYHVVVGADNAILDGFTITGGNANGAGNDERGGGMYNHYSSPTVTNCTFSGNSATNDGGAMYNNDSSPTVTNCTFSSNSANWAGGGMYNLYSSPMVTNCTFDNNSATVAGGGMLNDNCSPTVVTNCIFSGNSANWGGGMNNIGCSPTVTNCRFSSNSATWGGGMLTATSSPPVTNCIFSGNSATWGGGMYNRFGSSPPVTNCTFSSNSATYGGGMYNEGSSPTLTNCILWDTGEEIANDVDSTPLVTYCDVQGGYPGVGNISYPPMFVDPADDYHLQAGSPCIDAGTDEGAPTEDIEGNPRPIDGDGDATATTDMGAYEYVPPPPVGGTIIPTDKLGLVMPWVIAAALIVAAGVSLAVWNRRWGGERASGR